MKRASEHLAEIQARIAGLLDEYEWGGARTQAHVWVHDAEPELLDAAEELQTNRRYVTATTGCVAVSPGGDHPGPDDRIAMCVFGREQPSRGDPA